MKTSVAPTELYLVEFWLFYYGTTNEYLKETRVYHSLGNTKAGITYVKRQHARYRTNNFARVIVKKATVGEFKEIEL